MDERVRSAAALLAVPLLLCAGLPAVGTAQEGGTERTCTFPTTIGDATGTEVTIAERPERVVTLNPSATQTLWELGARDRVVGISEYGTYLNGTEGKTVVNTGSGGVAVEEIVALRPDLVLAPGTVGNETVENLRAKGPTVLAVETPNDIDGVGTKTRLLGRAVGSCDAAERTNAWMRANVDGVREATRDADRPRAMYLFHGYTVGRGTFIHDVLTAAGLENVMATAGVSGYGQVNREVVRNRTPEWIVVNDADPGVPADPAYNETTAVQRGQIVTVDVDHMNQPAPRSVVFAVRNVSAAVHPEAFDDVEYVSRAGARSAAANGTATAADSPARSSTATDASGSGFGVLAGIVGVTAALLVAARLRPGEHGG